MTIREGSIAQKVLKTDDLPREMVPTPEWPDVDGQIYARRLSGDELDIWETFLAHQVDPKEIDSDTRFMKLGTKQLRAQFVILGACDEDGDTIFGQGDLIPLGMKSSGPLERIRDVIRRLSGMDSVKKGDDEDETEKNLPEAPGSDSSTDSPSNSDTSVSEQCSPKLTAVHWPDGVDTTP